MEEFGTWVRKAAECCGQSGAGHSDGSLEDGRVKRSRDGGSLAQEVSGLVKDSVRN